MPSPGRRPKISAPLENSELRSSTMSRLRQPLEAIDMAAARDQGGHARQQSESSAASEAMGLRPRRPPMPPTMPTSQSAPQLTVVGSDGYVVASPSRSHIKRSKEPKTSKRGTTRKHGPVGPDTVLDIAPRLPDALELLAHNPRISAGSMLDHVDLRIQSTERAAQDADRLRTALQQPRAAPQPSLAVVIPSMARSTSLPDVSGANQTEAAALKQEVQQLLRSTPSPSPVKRKRSAFARLFGVGGGRRSEDTDREPRTSDESLQHGSRSRKGRARAQSDRERPIAFAEHQVQPTWIPPTAIPLPYRQHASAEAEDALEVVAERAQMPEALRDFQWLAKTSLLVEDPTKLNIPGAASSQSAVRRRSLSAPPPPAVAPQPDVRQSVDRRQASTYRYVSPRERALSRSAAPTPIDTSRTAPFMSLDDSPPTPPRTAASTAIAIAPCPATRSTPTAQPHERHPSMSASIVVPTPTTATMLHPPVPGRKLVSARSDRRIGVEPVTARVPTWLRDLDGSDDEANEPLPPVAPFARSATPTRPGTDNGVVSSDESPGTDLPASVRGSSAGSDGEVDDRALFQLGTNLLKRAMSDASDVDPKMRYRVPPQPPSFAAALGYMTTAAAASDGEATDSNTTPELDAYATFESPFASSPDPRTPPSISILRNTSGRRVPMPLDLSSPPQPPSSRGPAPPRPPRSPDRLLAALPQQSPHDQARLVLERARTNRRRPKVDAIDRALRPGSSDDDHSSLSSELTSIDHTHGVGAYRPSGGPDDVQIVEELETPSAGLTPMSFASADVTLMDASHAHLTTVKARYLGGYQQHPASASDKPRPSPAPYTQLAPPFEPSSRSRTPSPTMDGRKPLRRPGEAPAMRARLDRPPGLR